MTKDEALKLALEALKQIDEAMPFPVAKLAQKVIKEALAEPEQEPVAWVDLLKEAQQIVESKVLWKRFIDGTPLSNDIACWMAAFAQQHTTPPQHTWVGLTDGDIAEIYNQKDWDIHTNWDYERAIEAKLKEKNNG